MADKKISNLTALTTPASADEIPIVDNSATETKKITFANLAGGASATEIGILDGATLTTTELNYVDGVTSDIQTQLDAKIESLAGDTSPQLGGDLDLSGNNIDFPTTSSISDCLDEDNMISDTTTALATQQSIKAYVDNNKGLSSSFRAYRDTSKQVISSTTETKVEFNAEDWDTDGEYDDSTSYQFTATNAGKYYVAAGVRFDDDTTGTLYSIRIYKNSTQVQEEIEYGEGSGESQIQLKTANLLDLSASDTVEIRAFHKVGSDVDINDDSRYTFFAMHRLK